MKTAILVISIIIGLCVALVLEEAISARWSVKRVERINERMASLRDLVKTTPPDTNALNLLILAASSKDPWERGAAIGFLGQAGTNSAPAVDVLLQTLASGDRFDARGAAQSLGGIGAGAYKAVPALIEAVQKYQDADIGWFAAESLGHIATPSDKHVIEILKQAASSSDERMRHSAKEGLLALGITNDAALR